MSKLMEIINKYPRVFDNNNINGSESSSITFNIDDRHLELLTMVNNNIIVSDISARDIPKICRDTFSMKRTRSWNNIKVSINHLGPIHDFNIIEIMGVDDVILVITLMGQIITTIKEPLNSSEPISCVLSNLPWFTNRYENESNVFIQLKSATFSMNSTTANFTTGHISKQHAEVIMKFECVSIMQGELKSLGIHTFKIPKLIYKNSDIMPAIYNQIYSQIYETHLN